MGKEPSAEREAKMPGAVLLPAAACSARSRSIGARFSVSMTLTCTSDDRSPKNVSQASGVRKRGVELDLPRNEALHRLCAAVVLTEDQPRSSTST